MDKNNNSLWQNFRAPENTTRMYLSKHLPSHPLNKIDDNDKFDIFLRTQAEFQLPELKNRPRAAGTRPMRAMSNTNNRNLVKKPRRYAINNPDKDTATMEKMPRLEIHRDQPSQTNVLSSFLFKNNNTIELPALS